MADHAEESARPAKRARLDDNTTPTLSSAPAPQAAPTATSIAAIDTDLEREVRAGITEYVCPDNLGFTGVLKQRYTDFLVNEIGLDGQVLHLRSMDVPRREKDNVNGKQANGTEAKKEETRPVKEEVAIKEETGDATMVDVKSEPVQTEDPSTEDGTTVVQKPDEKTDVKEEEIKQEPEPEVSFQDTHLAELF
jgi:tRNA pseudouridine13 synthase